MTEILKLLNNLLQKKSDTINDWLKEQHVDHAPFFYNSVDIRYSGSKIAPVDTNIFPAGFNNLSQKAKEQACIEISNLLKNNFPDTKKIIIIAESHTRNLHYLENLKTIEDFFINIGKNVKCAYFDHLNNNHILNLKTSNQKDITIYPLQRKNDQIFVSNNFIADLIIVNNDLTKGKPEILSQISQHVIPSTDMGWYRRKKHNHCLAYNHIASNFAKEFNLDAFLITTELDFCDNINFNQNKGIECIAINVEKTLQRIKHK